MKKHKKLFLWSLLAVMLAGVVSCGEKETTSRYKDTDLLGRWQYYSMFDPSNPASLQPGIHLELRRESVRGVYIYTAVVDGQAMRWTYENNIVSATLQEGNVIRWLKFEVIDIDKVQGLMRVSGAHGWCENVAGTEWNTDRMAGHSWPLEQPGFFAKI